ncbi:MAG: tyrosine-type recombinase/integrase [Gammaproteobacteria bacterium]|nr:tyrosine-type recombinase/integrase [Gammaproteobacteria bacterium]
MSESKPLRLTKESIARMPLPEDSPKNRKRGVWYSDHEVSKLCLVVFPSGSKRWKLRYRIHGRQRFLDVGDATALHPIKARQRALEHIVQIDRGEDPAELRRLARQAALDAENAEPPKTVADIADEWLEKAKKRKKKSSIDNDILYIEKYIKPEIGTIPIADLQIADVEKLHEKIGNIGIPRKPKAKPKPSKYMANRVRAVISAVLNFSEPTHRHAGSNFCKHITPFKEERKHQILSEIELRRLGNVLDEWPTKPKMGATRYRGKRKGETIISEPLESDIRRRKKTVDCIRLIFATGCRRSEITKLQWSEVDTERGVLLLKDSKSGSRQVVLTKAAVAIIEKQERGPLNPYVFPGLKPSSPLFDLKRAWPAIRVEARVGHFRLHDARHQLGQTLADLGYGELIIGQCLGHRGHSVTAKYIGVGLDIAREAMERYGETIRPIVGGALQDEQSRAGGES